MAIGTTAAILGASALGAGASIFGASQAAGAQTRAAEMAAAEMRATRQQQQEMYERLRNDMMPYMNMGNAAAGDLQSRLPFLTSPIVMDQNALEQTPGYQFTRDQGLRAAQNALASTGMGRSGAAVKAATRFGTGLADQTYQTQFNLENINRGNAFNRLMDVSRLGQSAAGATGNAGVATGQNMGAMSSGIGNSLIGAGNAQGAAWMSGANAIGNAANNALGAYMFNGMTNPGGGGGMYSGQNAWINYPGGVMPGGAPLGYGGIGRA